MPIFQTGLNNTIQMLPVTNGTPADGQVWYDNVQNGMAVNADGITQHFVGCIFTASASKTITNSTAATSAVPTGIGTLTLPANFWQVGKTLRIRGGGVFSTATLTPGSFAVSVKHGTVTLVTATVSSILSNLSSAGFTFEEVITCQTTGSSGTLIATGGFSYSTGLNLSRNFVDLTNNGTATTINTTTPQLLDIIGQWGSASTSNILTTTNVIAEVFN